MPKKSPSTLKKESVVVGQRETTKTGTIGLNENMHTAMVVLPLVDAGDGPWKKVFIFSQIGFLYFFNLMIQALLTFYIVKMYNDNTDELGECGGYQTYRNLRYMCTALYVAYTSKEIFTTLDLAMWVSLHSTIDTFQKLKYTPQIETIMG
eukprot:UN31593